MVQLFNDGGGFMWPILIIFIIGLGFVLERLYHLFMGLSSNEEFAIEVANTVSHQGIDAAKQLFGKTLSKDLINKETGDLIDEKGTSVTEEKLKAWSNMGVIEKSIKITDNAVGPVANLCLATLDRAHLGADEAEHVLDHSGSIEMASMEKNMTWISLCIATAPMLGFLGTVWGMIQAFNDIKMANDISPAVVAGGISVALLTTAFGLVVAVILQIFQNAVLYIIDNQIVTLQKSTAALLQAIKDMGKN